MLGGVEGSSQLAQLFRQPTKLGCWKFIHQVLARSASFFADRRRDGAKRFLVETAGIMQLGQKEEHDVELANAAKAVGHLAQASHELVGLVAVELEHRQQLTQPSRRDAHTMKRAHVVPFNAV